MKIGIMFGNPETTTGGNALKFYSSVRLEVKKIETIQKTAEEIVGNMVKVKVVKNKVAPPFKKIDLEIIFGKGISAISALLDAAVNTNIIQKSGSWYSYKDEKIGQGKDNTKEFLEKNVEILKEVEEKVREILFPGKTEKPVEDKKAVPAEKKSETTDSQQTDKPADKQTASVKSVKNENPKPDNEDGKLF
jgi:recombination protein RecA